MVGHETGFGKAIEQEVLNVAFMHGCPGTERRADAVPRRSDKTVQLLGRRLMAFAVGGGEEGEDALDEGRRGFERDTSLRGESQVAASIVDRTEGRDRRARQH
jgi:hypothetical protein